MVVLQALGDNCDGEGVLRAQIGDSASARRLRAKGDLLSKKSLESKQKGPQETRLSVFRWYLRTEAYHINS